MISKYPDSFVPLAKKEPLFPGLHKFHFVGIGGIGMSALAKALRHLGFSVSGSDRKETLSIQKMRELGIQISIGHGEPLSDDVSVLVYSTAIEPDNPELEEALRRGIPIKHRSEVLAEFMNKRPSISVTGTHGKTTTTALVSYLLTALGESPTCLVGGILMNAQDNAILGSDDLIVAEVDESDKTQRRYFPLHSVITNMEREHLDHYSDYEDIKKCFRSYGYQTRPEGYLVINHDDENLRNLFASYPHLLITYGFDRDADFWADEVVLEAASSSFLLHRGVTALGRVKLSVPGLHNVSNSLAALGLLISLGYPSERLLEHVSNFNGTGRRLEVKLNTERLMVVDDYAHHPTEIQASLKALKGYGRPVTAIFQPHRFSRTKGLLPDFGPSFRDADRLILTDIYSAGEKNPSDISAEEVLAAVRSHGHANASFVHKDELLKLLEPDAEGGGIFAFLGAGDIGEIANAFAVRFKS